MKKTTHKLAKSLSEMAISFTRTNVNSVCWSHFCQPKLPDGFIKLKK